MIGSTKMDSVSNTNFHGSPDEEGGTKNYNFNTGSPSQFSKKRDSAKESSPQQPSIPQKGGTTFAETLQAEITKLRPITAQQIGKKFKPNELMTSQMPESTTNKQKVNNFF